jgi:CBS domain containing-hemolysin-like protein
MILKLSLTALFVLLNAFFVAAEFSLVKMRLSHVQVLAAQGNVRAKRVASMMADLDLYLSACQLGITVASLVLGYLAEPAFADLILGIAARLGMTIGDSGAVHIVAFGLALTVVTVLHMVLGEQAPKIWAIQTAERTGLLLSGPLRAFTIVLRPLILGVNAMSNGLLRILGLPAGHGEHDTDVRELKGIIGAAASAGNISARQRTFAENILDLIKLEVRHVMLPRTEIEYLETRNSLAENLAKISDLGHSRWPLTQDGLDDVVGVVLVRDVLRKMLTGEAVDLEALARPPLFVPDTQPLSRFIAESQQTGQQAAFVRDEHGTTVGMVFLEDALEEIVGPLPDEHDEIVPDASVQAGNAFEMEGSVSLPKAGGILGTDLGDEHDTVGGLVVSLLGRLPRKGDKVVVQGYDAHILQTGKRRSITQIRFVPRKPAEDADVEDPDDPAADAAVASAAPADPPPPK